MLRHEEEQQLETLKLPEAWVDLAHKVGLENFLMVWRTFDSIVNCLHEGEGRRLYIPDYKKWEKKQRNQFIKCQAEKGYSVTEIRKQLKTHLNESCSDSMIYKILRY